MRSHHHPVEAARLLIPLVLACRPPLEAQGATLAPVGGRAVAGTPR